MEAPAGRIHRKGNASVGKLATFQQVLLLIYHGSAEMFYSASFAKKHVIHERYCNIYTFCNIYFFATTPFQFLHCICVLCATFRLLHVIFWLHHIPPRNPRRWRAVEQVRYNVNILRRVTTERTSPSAADKAFRICSRSFNPVYKKRRRSFVGQHTTKGHISITTVVETGPWKRLNLILYHDTVLSRC